MQHKTRQDSTATKLRFVLLDLCGGSFSPLNSSPISKMSWAKYAIEKLKGGETVQIRPRGHSMKGKVNDGDLVTVEPCNPEELSVGGIVLERVKGNDYLHLIKATNQGRFLIGNNRGGINGWVGHNCIYEIATKVESK
jgi:Peptidase S24-like